MNNFMNSISRQQRRRRTRKIRGTKTRPRVSVFRTNRGIWVQLIDDENSHTLASAHSKHYAQLRGIEQAQAVGQNLAKQAADQKLKEVVFDRSGYRYHGRVKALADALREAGIKV